MIGPKITNWKDLAEYHEKIVNNLGYFAMSRSRIVLKEKSENYLTEDLADVEYFIEPTSPFARSIYWLFYINTAIKAVFLSFLITNYFGPLEFLDKITALDYILCVGIVTFGSCIWFFKYPIHEIFHSFWTVENSIFASLGFPQNLKTAVNRDQYITVWVHLAIVWFGCTILVTQFYEDPKYCVWTYSAFDVDTWYLRIIFCIHEFVFMMHPWNNMTGSSSLCAFHGIAFSNVIDGMTHALNNLRGVKFTRKMELQRTLLSLKNKNLEDPSPKLVPNWRKTAPVNATVEGPKKYTIDQLIFDYKKLMIISELFNDWVSYKIVFLHACGYCQFISDVFVAMQVLKIPGTGIMDVWFYIEDSLASMYVIYRVYTFMSHVKPASEAFLRSLNLYIAECRYTERRRLLKTFKTLRIVSLKLGPCPVTPFHVLKALEMLGNYYVCVALWK